MTDSPAHKRILLKLSGEILAGGSSIFDSNTIRRIVSEIKAVHQMGVQIGLVVGGGNIFRGNMGHAQGIDKATADYMGMIATVMNALALHDAMTKADLPSCVMTAVRMNEVAEHYTRDRAFHHLSKGRIVIFAAGIGCPFFSTDTAATLRASEMQCELLLKGTKVDGIYTKDPQKHADADFIARVDYKEVLVKGLKVMDATAISLAQENNIPIKVFNISRPGELLNVVCGKGKYTLVQE